VALEELAQATDKDDAEIRRLLRETQDKWKQNQSRSDPPPPGLDARFRNARTAVDAMLSARARSRGEAVWQTLAAKERLCEDLDRRAVENAGPLDEAGAAAVLARWAEMPALAGASEKTMSARRDAALRALAEAGAPGAIAEYAAQIERGALSRHECLLELEMTLKLDSPAELQSQRLALQVKQLKARFENAAAGGAKTPADLLLLWCAQPGVADARDRQRCERVVAALAKGG